MTSVQSEVRIVSEMKLSQLDRNWLAYASDVAGCDEEHLSECRSLRKPWFPSYGLDDNVRWPDNLGSRYESAPIRLFCVAQIHNDKHLAASFKSFEEHLRAWHSGTVSPSKYLRDSQREYERTIPEWGTWLRFQEIFNGVKQPITPADVLYKEHRKVLGACVYEET